MHTGRFFPSNCRFINYIQQWRYFNNIICISEPKQAPLLFCKLMLLFALNRAFSFIKDFLPLIFTQPADNASRNQSGGAKAHERGVLNCSRSQGVTVIFCHFPLDKECANSPKTALSTVLQRRTIAYCLKLVPCTLPAVVHFVPYPLQPYMREYPANGNLPPLPRPAQAQDNTTAWVA